jgi:hypothetical protein
MPVIDDKAAPGVEPTPKADGLPESQKISFRMAGRQHGDRKRVRGHQRTTRAARAEFTQSAKDPNATSMPRLPGA